MGNLQIIQKPVQSFSKGQGKFKPEVKEIPRNEKGQFIKGFIPITAFKKGLIPWNKGKKLSQYSGENHFAWKGNGASYNAIHHWIERQLGKPEICEKCKRKNLTGKLINWANKSGKYLRDIKDWIRLCRRCHHKFDDIGKKLWKTRRILYKN